MVLNTLYLFLILLMAVLLSVWLGNSLITTKKEEPFVSYAYHIDAGNPINKDLTKIYDNLFYENLNANLIEMNGTSYIGNTDATGSSISGVWIATRQDSGSKIVYYSMTDETVELDKVVDSYQPFVYNSKCKNTDPYCVLYMPWKDLTFIHVIDLSKNQHKVSELYYANGNTTSTIVYTNAPFYPSGISAAKTAVGDTDPNNNNFFTLTNYDVSFSIFQITNNFYFDNRNAQVVLLDRKNNNQLTVYGRDGSILSSPYNNNRVISKTDFNTWSVYDANGVKKLLYMSIGTNTLIAIIEPDGNNSFRLFSVNRFSGPNLDNNTSNPISSSAGTTATPETMMTDYYKWFYFWTMKGIQDPSKHNYNYSDDYFLKTQLVPNVNTGSFFVNGVNGVNVGTGGTVGPNGVSIVGGIPVSNANYINGIPGYYIQNPNQYNNNDFLNFMQSSGSGFSNFAQDSGSGLSDFVQSSGRGIKNEVNYVGRGVANQANKAASGTVEVGKDIASGTVEVGKDIAGGTVGLGKDIAGGTVGLGKDIVGGTVGLGKDIVGGTVGLGKDAWKEIKSLGSGPASSDKKNTDSENQGDPLRAGYENANVSGNKNAGSSSNYDKYSYFGAVPNKGANFIPITSDFSKFGR